MGPADIGKLLLALLVLVAGIIGFYYFAAASQALRVVGVMAAVVAAMAIATFTQPGRKLGLFSANHSSSCARSSGLHATKR